MKQQIVRFKILQMYHLEENCSQSLQAKISCRDLEHASRFRSCSLYASDVSLWEVPVNTVYMCEYYVVPRLTRRMGRILYLRKLGTIASMSPSFPLPKASLFNSSPL